MVGGIMSIRRALLSVSDKAGLEELAGVLQEKGVELVASGGTALFLSEKGFSVTPVEKVTGNPEAFGGRLKTLSFELLGSILFRREHSGDCGEADKFGMKPIDLIVCNLYPFVKLAQEGRGWDELVENIDIGGVTLIRAGAKNYPSVTVLANPDQYREFIDLFERGESYVDERYRKKLAKEAYWYTSSYDQAVSQYWGGDSDQRELRYGENPHQKGWVRGVKGLAGVESLQGKPLSWNNLLDSDAACRSCWDLHFFSPDSDAVVVVKHGNPCGAALGSGQLKALSLAWEGDPISAFGSILCFNRELTGESARWLKEQFVEVIIAPDFSPESREILKVKKNVRLIALSPQQIKSDDLSLRSIDGGLLLQEPDHFGNESTSLEMVTEKKLSRRKYFWQVLEREFVVILNPMPSLWFAKKINVVN